MKKLIISLFAITLMSAPSFAATWVAADRVAPVGKVMLEKNGLPTTTTFKVVNGEADNSDVSTTNVVLISSTDLSYTGNDNEVAAVIGKELGHIINGKATKTKVRDFAKAAIASKLSADNVLVTAANSDYLASKASLSDNKAADVTGADLMIQAGYNPLAGVVVITKMPGSTLEVLQGKPANSERAMNLYDYLTYNYPSKVSVGYGCQEYRNFLAYADPIVKDRNANAKKLAKFNKEQAKNKNTRAKNLQQYKTTGMSGWESSYLILKTLTESSETK
ncbi:MAG: M48 family metalloprotease [bacterium]|nr:M48 family metalloprotease [bacterium]